MKKNICFFVIIIMTIMLFGMIPNAFAKSAIELKAVQFIYIGSGGEHGIKAFVNEVNKNADGELVIKIVGGPEAIPARKQVESVRVGAVDIAMVPCGWYASIVPVAAVMNLSKLEPWDQRKSGFHEYLVKEHKKAGFRFIGVGNVGDPFYLFANEPFKNMDQLRGKRFRHSPTYVFFKDMGIIPVTTAQSEMYTGLERNLFVGVANKLDGFIQNNLSEVCKYVIGPGFWPYSATVILMNEKKFSSLPANLQDIILKSQEAVEPQMKETQSRLNEEAWETLKQQGVKHIEWSPEDSKAFLEKVNEITWNVRSKRIPPEEAPKIKKMMGY